jgi:type I restriction enzyme S subunit
MDVKPGYKLTEIGIIPDDWDAVPLGDLFTFKNGLNKAKKYFGYGTPIVNYMDVFGQPALRANRIDGRVDVSKSELDAFEVRKGDVFFTRTSETVEEIGVAAAMLDPAKDTVFSGFVLRARPTDDSLDDHFKAYCFSPRYFRQQVIARATYTTRALTNGRSLSATILARPPRAEQEAIAEALSDVDAAIDAISGLIAKKRDLRTGAMQRLITGQTRLPGFTAPWQDMQLGELGRTYGGLTGKTKSDFGVGGARYVTFMGVVGAATIKPTSFDSVQIRSNERQNLVLEGDILFNGSSETPEEVALCAFVETREPNLYLNSFCFGYRQNTPEKLDGRFLVHLLRSDTGRKLVKELAQGSTRYNISKKSLMKVVIAAPEKAEQQAIVSVIADFDAEIDRLAARLAKTRDLKQAMMQALLTGQVRLPVSAVETCEPEAAHA